MSITSGVALVPRNLNKLVRDGIKKKGLENKTEAQGLSDLPSTGGLCQRWNGNFVCGFSLKAYIIFRDKVLLLLVVSSAK